MMCRLTRSKMFIPALNGHTWQRGELPSYLPACIPLPAWSLSKNSVSFVDLTSMIHTNGDNGAYFGTLTPQRNSWCALVCKSDEVVVRRMKKKRLSDSLFQKAAKIARYSTPISPLKGGFGGGNRSDKHLVWSILKPLIKGQFCHILTFNEV